jgi:hypothetical protein
VNVLIVLFLSTTVLTRRTGSPGLIKSFVIWTTSVIRIKSHKYMKGLEKIYIRPMTELQQYEYNAASQRFRDLRGAFKGVHRLKYAKNIEEDRGWSQK